MKKRIIAGLLCGMMVLGLAPVDLPCLMKITI